MTGVVITTGARLHFGPLAVAAPAGGRFGGVGVMIDSPRVVLSAGTNHEDVVHGNSSTKRRVLEFLHQIRTVAGPAFIPPCEITVEETIPSHCGFGSGTQLGLAIALATSLLANEPFPGFEILARRVGRGLRSAVGLHGFEKGGFLVDGGRAGMNRLGTLVTRVEFPHQWRFVIAAPRESIGLWGEAEQIAFTRQPPMPLTLTGDLCRIVLMDWLPAVIDHDYERCGAALFEFGHHVGEFFSPAQGGVFAHPRMAEWATLVQSRGIRGVAQTSWGPTIAALCRDEAMAKQVCSDFSGDANWSDFSFEIVSALNHGATIVRK